MNYKHIVETIHRHQLRNILTFEDIDGTTNMTNQLQTRQQGLYWFWTTYSFEELSTSTRPAVIREEIDIKELAEQRMEMNLICNEVENRFRIVYNGIGGGGNDSNYGLRERILQEIRIQEGTGSLSILNSSLSDCSKWRVTYVNFNDDEFLREIGEHISYLEHGQLFEFLWRMNYGWPLLCSR
jgi:hypothetical protein